MLKKLLFLAALVAAAPSAFACTSPVTVKDGNGNAQTFGATVDGGANCYGNAAIVDGSNAANKATVKGSGASAATTDSGIVVLQSPNPSTLCTSVKPISQTASTDLVTSTNKLHICSIVLISATAQNISLVEGTGSTCGTGTAALIGSTTAANGPALAANGGFSAVSDRAWLVTATTADHLCLLQSGAGNVSGVITYTDHN